MSFFESPRERREREQREIEERQREYAREEAARNQTMLLREMVRLERESLKLLEVIAREVHKLEPPELRLAKIKLLFTPSAPRPLDATFWDNAFAPTMSVKRHITPIPTTRTSTSLGASLMPTPGPITLTTAGQTATASVLWLRPIRPALHWADPHASLHRR